MPLVLFSLLLFFFIPSTSTSVLPSSYPYGLAYHIDCGSSTNTTDPFNTTFLYDRFFTGGATAIVSEPLRFQLSYERTLRFFPVSYGKKNCYVIPSLPSGRYFFRTFIVYDNYDAKSYPPSFDVSVQSTVVFSWRSPWPESFARDGAYSDLFAFVYDSDADVCFYSFATDSPVISSLELVQVDPLSYDSATTGDNLILVNYGRLSCGTRQWGPGYSNDTDLFGRSWQNDKQFRLNPAAASSDFSENFNGVREISTTSSISGTDQKPNYFPMKLYQSAVTVDGGNALEYELPVDAKLDYLVWLHFAEIDSTVRKAGERVFDVVINGKNVTRIDIYKQVGSFAAFTWHYTVKNLSTSILSLKLVAAVGAPLLSGLENYAIVRNDPSTVFDQVIAMKALKESLRIPDRMGWNGDPCAPTSWNAWEGVTCRVSNDKASLVISEIDLGSQGLKGHISDQITLLSDLVSLNLSSNFLEGTIPSELGQKSLLRLDLSNNQLTGSIPESLASSSLQLVLLNGNLLEGRVPEELYSIGMHGGVIDLFGNKGLCGVPSLPSCPILWENGRLSTRGKIAIAVLCVIFFCLLLLLVYIYIRRRRNDYDFGLPHEIMSLAAKRNRYLRQKSLMLLELESQHARGLPSPFTPQ